MIAPTAPVEDLPDILLQKQLCDSLEHVRARHDNTTLVADLQSQTSGQGNCDQVYYCPTQFRTQSHQDRNLYRDVVSDLTHGLAHREIPTRDVHLPSLAVVQASTFLVSDDAAATCLTTRMMLWLLVVLVAVVRTAFLTARMTSNTPGVNLIFRQMMLPLNDAV